MLSSFIWQSYEKPSSSYCVMLYFWWGYRRNLTLITLESERVNLLVVKASFLKTWPKIKCRRNKERQTSRYCCKMNLAMKTMVCHQKQKTTKIISHLHSCPLHSLGSLLYTGTHTSHWCWHIVHLDHTLDQEIDTHWYLHGKEEMFFCILYVETCYSGQI